MHFNINGKYFENETQLLSANEWQEDEQRVIEVIKLWCEQVETFLFKTSGSTGAKKTIEIPRKLLQYSATQTLNYLDPNRTFTHSLVCINPAFVGGTMAIIRALVGEHQMMTFASPSSLPFTNNDQKIDLVSLVPLQVTETLKTHPKAFDFIKTVIIGGAPLSQKANEQLHSCKNTDFYHSYGMTETASHFALKNLKQDHDFHLLGDAQVQLTEKDCLQVKGTITDQQWLTTTDIVKIKTHRSFEWLGRADFVINSGGIKIFPEEIEQKLSFQISKRFFVTGIPHEKLGEQLVLLLESEQNIDFNQIDWSAFEKYHIPKQIICLPAFENTDSGKIDRLKTLKLTELES